MDFILKKILSNKRGEIASIALIVGMVVVTLGVIAGGQYFNNRQNTTNSRASGTATAEAGPWTNPGTGAYVWGQVRTVDANGNYVNPAGKNSDYWQTSSACPDASTQAGLNVSNNFLNSCDAITNSPYFAKQLSLPANYTFTVQSIPAGYECVGWEHHLRYINPVNGVSEVVRDSGNGCSTSSLQMSVLYSGSNYKNAHYILFKIRSTKQLDPPNIKVTKRHVDVQGNPATVIKGSNVTYIIRAQNDGGQTATNVSISELLGASSPSFTFVNGIIFYYYGGATGPSDATKTTIGTSPASVTWSGFTIPVGGAVEVAFNLKTANQCNVTHQNSASAKFSSVSNPSANYSATYDGATTSGEEVKTICPTATPTITPTPTKAPTATKTPIPTPTIAYIIDVRDSSIASNLIFNALNAEICREGSWCVYNLNTRTRTTLNQNGTLTLHSNATPNEYSACWIQWVKDAKADGSTYRLKANYNTTFANARSFFQIVTKSKPNYAQWSTNSDATSITRDVVISDPDASSRFTIKYCINGTGTPAANATLTKISLVKVPNTPTPVPTIKVRANVTGNLITNTDGGATCALGKWCRLVRASSSTPLNADGSLGLHISPTAGEYGACWIQFVNGVYADGSTYRLRANFETNNDSADPATITIETENKANHLSNPALSGTSIDRTVTVLDPKDPTKRMSIKFCSWGTWVTKDSTSKLNSISFVKVASGTTPTATKTPTATPTPIKPNIVVAKTLVNPAPSTSGIQTVLPGANVRYRIRVLNRNSNTQKAVNVSIVELIQPGMSFVKADSIKYYYGATGPTSAEPGAKLPAINPSQLQWTGFTIPPIGYVDVEFTLKASSTCNTIHQNSANVTYSPESQPTQKYTTSYDGTVTDGEEVKVVCPPAATNTPTKTPTPSPVPTINVRANVTGNLIKNTDNGSTCDYGKWCRVIRNSQSGTPINPDGSISVRSNKTTGLFGACWIQWVQNAKADGSTYRVRANFDSNYRLNTSQIQIETKDNDGLKRINYFATGATTSLDKTFTLRNDDPNFVSVKFCAWGNSLPADSVATLKSISLVKTSDPKPNILVVKSLVNPAPVSGQIPTVNANSNVRYRIRVTNINKYTEKVVNMRVIEKIPAGMTFVKGEKITYFYGATGPTAAAPTAQTSNSATWSGITIPPIGYVDIEFTLKASTSCDTVYQNSVNTNYNAESDTTSTLATAYDGASKTGEEIKVVCPGTTPTLTPSPTNDPLPGDTATPTPKPGEVCPRRAEGDANCDGLIDVVDLACWSQYMSTKTLPDKCYYTDFDGKASRPGGDPTDVVDLGIWANTRAIEFDPNR